MTNLKKSKKNRQQQIRLKWTLKSLSNDDGNPKDKDNMVKKEFSYSLRFCLRFNRFIQFVSFTVSAIQDSICIKTASNPRRNFKIGCRDSRYIDYAAIGLFSSTCFVENAAEKCSKNYNALN